MVRKRKIPGKQLNNRRKIIEKLGIIITANGEEASVFGG